MPVPTDLSESIYQTAVKLLKENWARGTPVRLLGVTLGQLFEPSVEIEAEGDGVQLSLFDDPALSPASDTAPADQADQSQRDRWKKLSAVTDALRDKYGEDIVIRGRMLQDPESGQIRNRKIRGTSLQKDELSKSE